MLGPFQMSVFGDVLGGVTLAAVLGMWGMLVGFIKKQSAVNKVNKEFMHSQQRAEIMRAFQRHVEDGKPITLEEMEHLDKCYEAYHSDGCNGAGTFMYERVKRHAVLVTRVDDEYAIDQNRGNDNG